MGMLQQSHEDYDFYQMYSEPSDFNYGGTGRFRTWVVGAHKDATVCKYDPFQMLSHIKEEFEKFPSTQPSDYLVASKHELQLEAHDLAERRGLYYRPNSSNLDYLLNQRELDVKATLDARFQLKFQRLPWKEKNLIYNLTDNSSYGSSWSASSGKIPTFRCNAAKGIFWLAGQSRFMTAKEKLVAMGWPCVKEVSEAMEVPLVGASDRHRAAQLLGNGMHFQTCGIFQAIALSCFAPLNPGEGDLPL